MTGSATDVPSRHTGAAPALRRLMLVTAGAGVLLTSLPGAARAELAAPQGSGPGAGASVEGEAAALALLTAAARAARGHDYAGTQYVATWRGGISTSDVVEVSHRVGYGAVVRPSGGTTLTLDDAPLEQRLLAVLADSYDLVVAAPDTCSGRLAQVVEARRPGGAVAGRFWLDRETSLVLRREVYDRGGRRVRSAAFVDLAIGPGWPAPDVAREAPFVRAITQSSWTVAAANQAWAGRQVALDELDSMRRAGWVAPTTLPGGLELFAARHQDHAGAEVLHLAYSDGLSTLSVFAQPGGLGDRAVPGHHREQVGAAAAWVRPAATERVVWSGGGRVWTVVSDAPTEVVRDAVRALPAEPPARTGVLARLARGLSRVASWIPH